MSKRRRLLVVALFMIVGLTASSAFWVYSQTSAQLSRPEIVPLEDVAGLDSVRIDFGSTQNSLTLYLEGDSGTNQIDFALAEDIEQGPMYVGSGYTDDPHTVFIKDGVRWTYAASFRGDLSYEFKGEDSLPSLCGERPQITLTTLQKYEYEELNSYNPQWKQYDLNDKEFLIRISLPLLNSATATVADDCFILTSEIVFQNSDDKPLFVLSGDRFSDHSPEAADSCSGLEIYGRGEDDLHKPNITWYCYDDVNFLDGEHRDAFSNIESPPFDDYYIFIEQQRDNNGHCGGRIILDKAAFEADEIYVDIEWQDWRDDCKNGQTSKTTAKTSVPTASGF